MLNRRSPLELAGGLTLPNRVVVPPMASETASLAGFATPATIERYRERARSRAGLVWVEYSYVHPSGRSEGRQLGAWHDGQIEGLRALAHAIHAEGGRAGLQLTHAGGKSERALTGGVLRSPSGVRVPARDRELEEPGAMSAGEIALWRRWFFEAACRAFAAGFDLVELHAAHGYGLNQWLSPLTNRRTGGYAGYGGDAAGRARLVTEILRDIRSRFSPRELGLAVRMPGQDHLPGGLGAAEAAELARLFEAAGADLLDVSSGLGGWRRPRDREGEGYLVEDAARIAAAVSVPVIGVGGIRTGAFIDEALAQRRLALAAVGRAILEDPAGWGEAELAGNCVLAASGVKNRSTCFLTRPTSTTSGFSNASSGPAA